MKTKLKHYCNLGWNQNKCNFIKPIAGHNEATLHVQCPKISPCLNYYCTFMHLTPLKKSVAQKNHGTS